MEPPPRFKKDQPARLFSKLFWMSLPLETRTEDSWRKKRHGLRICQTLPYLAAKKLRESPHAAEEPPFVTAILHHESLASAGREATPIHFWKLPESYTQLGPCLQNSEFLLLPR